MKHLVLIDGHHLMHRAYWAIPRTLKTSSGEQVNTVFGVASMLLHILKIEQPDHFIVCFDAGGETFRHQENWKTRQGPRISYSRDGAFLLPEIPWTTP